MCIEYQETFFGQDVGHLKFGIDFTEGLWLKLPGYQVDCAVKDLVNNIFLEEHVPENKNLGQEDGIMSASGMSIDRRLFTIV
jgi:hypothetical protein